MIEAFASSVTWTDRTVLRGLRQSRVGEIGRRLQADGRIIAAEPLAAEG